MSETKRIFWKTLNLPENLIKQEFSKLRSHFTHLLMLQRLRKYPQSLINAAMPTPRGPHTLRLPGNAAHKATGPTDPQSPGERPKAHTHTADRKSKNQYRFKVLLGIHDCQNFKLVIKKSSFLITLQPRPESLWRTPRTLSKLKAEVFRQDLPFSPASRAHGSSPCRGPWSAARPAPSAGPAPGPCVARARSPGLSTSPPFRPRSSARSPALRPYPWPSPAGPWSWPARSPLRGTCLSRDLCVCLRHSPWPSPCPFPFLLVCFLPLIPLSVFDLRLYSSHLFQSFFYPRKKKSWMTTSLINVYLNHKKPHYFIFRCT